LRVLITVQPLIYRQALALGLHQNRPALDVRVAPPEVAAQEVSSFRPHLLVRNDTDGLEPETLGRVPFRVEVIYSDSMDTRLVLDGRVEEVRDASIEVLVRAADEACGLPFTEDGATPAGAP